MRHHILSLVGISIVFACTVNCQFKYDCRRMEDCKNRGTCVENDCTCTGTFGGYNCGYDTALVAACTADPNPCLNGGTCYNNGATDLCACPYGFYGNKCENETVQIECEGNEVKFNLAFPNDFEGTVKLGDKPECAMTELELPEHGLWSYSLTMDITGDLAGCNMSNIATATNAETGATEFSALFQVNYLPGITTNLDELYNLTCLHENKAIELAKGLPSLGVVKENLTVSDFNETYSPVEMTLLDMRGDPLTIDTQLFVGDEFQLHVYLSDDKAYTDVLIESCTTNNTLADADQKVFKILDRACPTKTSKRLTTGQRSLPYEKTLEDGSVRTTAGKVISIEAFKFVDSNSMGIVCSAKVCKADDKSCAVPTNCDDVMRQPPGSVTNTATPGATDATDETDATTAAEATATVEATAASETAGTASSPPASRRRRRAADDREQEKIVSAILTVLEPGDVPQNNRIVHEEENPVKECFAQDEITAMVAVLSTTVVVLFISCFVLTCLALKRRSKEAEFQSMPRPKAEAFHIPRAHINDSFSLGEI